MEKQDIRAGLIIDSKLNFNYINQILSNDGVELESYNSAFESELQDHLTGIINNYVIQLITGYSDSNDFFRDFCDAVYELAKDYDDDVKIKTLDNDD